MIFISSKQIHNASMGIFLSGKGKIQKVIHKCEYTGAVTCASTGVMLLISYDPALSV